MKLMVKIKNESTAEGFNAEMEVWRNGLALHKGDNVLTHDDVRNILAEVVRAGRLYYTEEIGDIIGKLKVINEWWGKCIALPDENMQYEFIETDNICD